MTKTTYKVGDKVRILDVENIIGGETHWDNGDIVKVTKAEGRIWLERKKTKPSPQKPFLHDNELRYIEKVESKPTKNQRISTLEQKVEALKAEINALKAAQKSAGIAKIAEGLAKMVGKKMEHTPNKQRKAIIDEAKVFVEAQFTEGNGKYVWGEHGHAKVDFYVNEEKRTVVAKLSNAYCGEWTRIRKAKCNPSDVFNADIGKAIALGRALGLDVSKFEKAVQPSEVVTGMHVDTYYIGSDEKNETCPTFVTHVLNGMPAFGNGTHSSVFKITDDTEAQY